jgi:hypothetical protein
MISPAAAKAGAAWRPMMEAIPLRNGAARVEREADGTLRAYVLKLRPWYMKPPLSWMMQARPERCLMLDRLGTEVWDLCDGTRNVESIVDRFAGKHRLSFHEAWTAVTSYLKMLIQPGVLAIALKKENVHETD